VVGVFAVQVVHVLDIEYVNRHSLLDRDGWLLVLVLLEFSQFGGSQVRRRACSRNCF
jgi:hypothetical protein